MVFQKKQVQRLATYRNRQELKSIMYQRRTLNKLHSKLHTHRISKKSTVNLSYNPIQQSQLNPYELINKPPIKKSSFSGLNDQFGLEKQKELTTQEFTNPVLIIWSGAHRKQTEASSGFVPLTNFNSMIQPTNLLTSRPPQIRTYRSQNRSPIYHFDQLNYKKPYSSRSQTPMI